MKNVKEENLVEKALKVAFNYHYGTTDRAEQPYILHCLRVMHASPADEDSMITAILHDIVEDTSITLRTLKKMGFSKDVVSAIDAISRRVDEEYTDYIVRVSKNPIAYYVKLADIEDNINTLRLERISSSDIKRVKKYHEAYRYLLANCP